VAADGRQKGFACGILRQRGTVAALEDEEFSTGDAGGKGLGLVERLNCVVPGVDHQRRGADSRQQGAGVEESIARRRRAAVAGLAEATCMVVKLSICSRVAPGM
jgi:hypothetical protein